MKVVTITEENAIKAYTEGTAKQKEMLINLCGKNLFLKDPKDRIKTFEDACEDQETSVEAFKEKYGFLDKSSYAFEQLKVITRSLNGGVVMDYKNTSVYKYHPYFYAEGHAKGFSFHDSDYGYELSVVSSRLCFLTADLATYAGKQFTEIYKAYLN